MLLTVNELYKFTHSLITIDKNFTACRYKIHPAKISLS